MPRNASKKLRIIQALDRYSGGRGIKGSSKYNGPDYAGFQDWFLGELKSLGESHQAPPHLVVTENGSIQFWRQFAEAVATAGIQVNTDGFKPIPGRFPVPTANPASIKAFDKGRLLLSLLGRTSTRELALLRLLSTPLSVVPRPETVSETSDQFDHRAAFFVAAANRDPRRAFKMLGRLRERDHDRGELKYLESFAEFQSGELESAIALASQVPQGAIDRTRAKMLIIEAYALKGDMEAFRKEIASERDNLFPDYFLPYVWQLLIKNTDDPSSTLDLVNQMGQPLLDGLLPGSGIYTAWNRQSCGIATQFVEHRRDLDFRDAAQEQAGGSVFDSELEDVPLAVQRIAAALQLDPDLYTNVATLDSSRASEEIVKRLLNHADHSASDYLQALLTQWRIGNRDAFVENVLRSAGEVVKLGHDGAQITRLAYREALFTRRTDAAEQLRKLLSIETGQDDISTLDYLEKSVSPMGKLALQAAYADLSAAERDNNIWRDAGMVSLGFFRVLELEVNDKIILPLLALCVDVDISEKLTEMRSLEQTSKIQKSIRFWDNIEPSIKRARAENKGLDLGAIEVFLGKIRDTSGVDHEIKRAFHEGMQTLLSKAGIEAFKGGKLGQLVNQEARERFRNPPAHTRYVGLPRAREAKSHVEEALSNIFIWTASNAKGCLLH